MGELRIVPSNALFLALVPCAVSRSVPAEAPRGDDGTQVVARTASRVAVVAVVTLVLALLALARVGGGGVSCSD
jgi:hypothetical protein